MARSDDVTGTAAPARPAAVRAPAPTAGRPPARGRGAGSLRGGLAHAGHGLRALLVPPACALCRRPLADAAEAICGGCRARLPWLRGPCCPRCALPLPCAPCPAREAPWERAWAPLAYAGTARDAVLALKFRGRFALAEAMAASLAALAPAELLAGTAIVPVPLPRARRRARGFDQALALARVLAARTGSPLAPCLRRHGAPTRQLGAGRATRRARGRVAVAVHGTPPPLALVVDDVHTTGATFAACARALRAAGSERVHVVAWTRALPARSCAPGRSGRAPGCGRGTAI